MSVLKKILPIQSERFIGMDINHLGIRILELKQTTSNYIVENYAFIPLPENAYIENHIQDADAFALAVRSIPKHLKQPCQKVALSIPGSAVITTTTHLDKSLLEHEIEELVLLEAERQFSDQEHQFSVDYCILGDSFENPEHHEILIAATRTDNMMEVTSALSQIGMKTEIVDIDYFAIANACEYLYHELFLANEQATVAVTDISAGKLSFFVIRNSLVIYSREVALECGTVIEQSLDSVKDNEQVLTQSSQQTFNVDQNHLINHINRALQFFYSVNEYTDVDQLILCGSAIESMSLDENAVSNAVGVKANIANMDNKISLSEHVASQETLSPGASSLCCLGLAIQGLKT